MDYESLLAKAEQECEPVFARFARIERENFARVLQAFTEENVGTQHFAPTTGYGYDDVGRQTLERVFARVFGCESALVRPHIVSGTHALALGLFGLLRPGQRLLAAAGRPYDTLEPVIGIERKKDGSLADWGVGYDEAALLPNGEPDLAAIGEAVCKETGVVLVQRSRGYAWRPALSLEQIGAICETVHRKNPQALVMVDNCYGEFTCTQEPTAYGADMMVGSLIKNPGGGLAPTGAYVAGRESCVARVAERLTAPGIGGEEGSYAASYQPFFQGFYLAPHTVAQALRGAALAACAFARAGYTTHPAFDGPRSDIIQAVRLETPERLVAFCRAVQAASPVDSFALPEPSEMPGYQDQVIMAAGTFVSGASIELSADAPMREPYIAYWQGGLTYEHCRLTVKRILEEIGCRTA